MIYATTCAWLIAIVVLAWGIHHIWCGMIHPKRCDAALLPGTLAARLGRILALLITGAKVGHRPQRPGNGGDAADNAAAEPQPKLPVLGPIVAGLIPMLVLGILIYLVVIGLGAAVLAGMPQEHLTTELPRTMTAFWDQLVGLIRLAQATMTAVQTAEAMRWQLILFGYLMICLTVRMAPWPGNAPGHIAAIAVLGLAGWLAGSTYSQLPEIIMRGWPVLSLTLGWLVLLMMITLAVRGAVSVIRAILRLEE